MAAKREAPKRRATLTERQVIEIAHEAFVSPSTVRRWAAGAEVLETTDHRITNAAKKKGVLA